MGTHGKSIILGLAVVLLAAAAWQPWGQKPCAPSSDPATVRVASLDGLRQALDTACPGAEILIRPGHYRGRIIVRRQTAGTADRPIVVTAEQGLGSVTIDGAGASITWKFSGSRFIHLTDLQITGGGYHGIFFDHGANNILVENTRVFDNHRIRPLDSHAEIKGSPDGSAPRNIVLRGNEIFHRTHPPGSNFQGIDCNLCRGFQVLDNHIHDINSPTAFDYSYYDRGSCIQFKSASRDIVIAGNLIERCHIGIVLGGEGLASPENIAGIVRNNVVTDFADIGVAVVNAKDFRLYGNRIIGAGRSILLARDRNYPDAKSSGRIEDNDLSAAPVNEDPGSTVKIGNNRVRASDD